MGARPRLYGPGARFLHVTATGLENGCWLGIREVEVFDTLPLLAEDSVGQRQASTR